QVYLLAEQLAGVLDDVAREGGQVHLLVGGACGHGRRPCYLRVRLAVDLDLVVFLRPLAPIMRAPALTAFFTFRATVFTADFNFLPVVFFLATAIIDLLH